MKTSLKSKSKTQKTLQHSVKLIDGCFTNAEARDILSEILDVKINFHKLQRLSKTEGNINDACEFDNSRIIELIDSKQDTKTFLSDPKWNGKTLKIESTVTITVTD
ncbi:hypothetical protein KFZ70_01455 [Tamlana fucoidanivorans]|uniref:Uncharacterized protein n=1 Tax=Allotamlana fucoidanivorans TaxID=2583814 RepID=A0A5C4SN61_9FLAO|nr:hypothetical protein [Tamlana fucoidanivorans]TNJ44675.1 hypothetical protein FGF67_08520 [Tamlana fucoidanivorans]